MTKKMSTPLGGGGRGVGERKDEGNGDGMMRRRSIKKEEVEEERKMGRKRG